MTNPQTFWLWPGVTLSWRWTRGPWHWSSLHKFSRSIEGHLNFVNQTRSFQDLGGGAKIAPPRQSCYGNTAGGAVCIRWLAEKRPDYLGRASSYSERKDDVKMSWGLVMKPCEKINRPHHHGQGGLFHTRDNLVRRESWPGHKGWNQLTNTNDGWTVQQRRQVALRKHTLQTSHVLYKKNCIQLLSRDPEWRTTP